MKRYHPVLVFLHWLLVIMILMGLIMGGNVLSETANSDPQKIAYLRIHMSMGMLILILMVVRLIVRIFTCHPPQVDIGNVVFNKLGVVMHYLLYGVIFLMGATGIVIAIMTGLPDIIFAGSGEPLPLSFGGLQARVDHGVLSLLLKVLIVVHITAFIYHQFVRKDQLFSRMWFGRRQ